MPAERIRPKGVRVFWVSHRDVSRHSLGEPFACKDPEGAGHVGEHPRAVLVIFGKEWNARKTYALGYGLECRLFFLLAFGPRGKLFRLRCRRRDGFDGDGGWCHLVCDKKIV